MEGIDAKSIDIVPYEMRRKGQNKSVPVMDGSVGRTQFVLGASSVAGIVENLCRHRHFAANARRIERDSTAIWSQAIEPELVGSDDELAERVAGAVVDLDCIGLLAPKGEPRSDVPMAPTLGHRRAETSARRGASERPRHM